ncbi:hypothetical protein HO173_002296 [Letharia columbiana]|uniref:Uncharacterized protein n=1 Tax=Letharia columbiana TaxID=112416 RepID=A0A8H6L8S6_9LECA|nr:uncharacterized protein HO173_002296 [Letharia columbiana]KAF6239750.1 hypothetical protein HO173_002296 [Letharia columbiana]
MPTQSSPPGAQKLRSTVRKLVKKIKPPKEGPMPGELDSTEVQLARFFGKPVAIASIASMEHPSPAPSLASSCPTEQSCDGFIQFGYSVRLHPDSARHGPGDSRGNAGDAAGHSAAVGTTIS